MYIPVREKLRARLSKKDINYLFVVDRLPACNSLSYLKFVKRLILGDFSPGSLSEEEELMLAMFHYDVWQKSGAGPGFVDFRESVKKVIK